MGDEHHLVTHRDRSRNICGLGIPFCPDEELGLLPLPALDLVHGDHEVVHRLLRHLAVPPTHTNHYKKNIILSAYVFYFLVESSQSNPCKKGQ